MCKKVVARSPVEVEGGRLSHIDSATERSESVESLFPQRRPKVKKDRPALWKNHSRPLRGGDVEHPCDLGTLDTSGKGAHLNQFHRSSD